MWCSGQKEERPRLKEKAEASDEEEEASLRFLRFSAAWPRPPFPRPASSPCEEEEPLLLSLDRGVSVLMGRAGGRRCLVDWDEAHHLPAFGCLSAARSFAYVLAGFFLFLLPLSFRAHAEHGRMARHALPMPSLLPMTPRSPPVCPRKPAAAQRGCGHSALTRCAAALAAAGMLRGPTPPNDH